MAETEMNEFLQEFHLSDLELPQQTKDVISDLLDSGHPKETLAEEIEEKISASSLSDASAEEITEAVDELAVQEQDAEAPYEEPSGEEVAGPEEEGAFAEQPAVAEQPVPTEEPLPSDEEVLGVLIPALATDANQTIEASKTALFADITRQLWDAVTAEMGQELAGQELTGTREEISLALYAAAWEAMIVAADGFCEAGAEPNEAGLFGYAALLSQE